MKTINLNKYPDLKENIEDVVHNLYKSGQSIYTIPDMTFQFFSNLIDFDQNDYEGIKSAILSYVAKKFMKEYKCCGEDNIAWKNIPRLKTMLWTNAIKYACIENTMESIITKLGQDVLKISAAQDYLLWIGMYIVDMVEEVCLPHEDMALAYILYSDFEEKQMYRGKIAGTEEWKYSASHEGFLDPSEKELLAYFIPETVDKYVFKFDDTKWDELSVDQQEEFLARLPMTVENDSLISQVWRGLPIFENDIFEISAFKKDTQDLMFKVKAMFLFSDGGISLLYLNNVPECNESKMNFTFKIVGNLHDNPEYVELYEQALTNRLLNS